MPGAQSTAPSRTRSASSSAAMDRRRKSSQDASRPPPRPRRPSASLPSVPLLRTFEPTFPYGPHDGDGDPYGDREIKSASAAGPSSGLGRRPSAATATTPATATAPGAGAGAGAGAGQRADLRFALPRRISAGSLRSTAYRPGITTPSPTISSTNPAHAYVQIKPTIRAVTPGFSAQAQSQPHAHAHAQIGIGTNIKSSRSPAPALSGGSVPVPVPVSVPVSRGLGPMSPSSSPPRSIPTHSGSVDSVMSAASPPGGTRRQGIVFNDVYPSSLDSVSSSPPRRPSTVRPRGHTMDVPYRQSSVTPPIENSRHRMGSVSSTGSMSSMPPHEEILRGPPVPKHSPVADSPGYSSVYHSRPTDLHIQTGGLVRDKRSSTRAKLMKRTSRPSSPMLSPPASVDSLPLPIPTDDANWILKLMKFMCGRMRGEIAYQNDANGPWYTGLGYIDDDRGSLMFDSGDTGPFHTAIIPDLRGIRVLPVERPGMDRPCLEVCHPQTGIEVLLWPLKPLEVDYWLAALLCWQQLRPNAGRVPNSQSSTPTSQSRPDMLRRGSSTASTAPNVIKVSMVSLWDRGAVHSPRMLVNRASARDLRSQPTGWRKVSCILYDNGDVKLEENAAALCIIPLPQLSRSAIQQLDKSVLNEEFCLAIFPIYAATSNQLSLFRPVYISLDHRVLFEVWFVLLRAFTVPLIYMLEDPHQDGSETSETIPEVFDFDTEPSSEMFRVEKTISLRIIEAKFGGPTSPPPYPGSMKDRHAKNEQDALVGNYFAEVMLDGEIRARTTEKTATRTPFWRDDCEFVDLPGSLPSLTVRLKRVDGNVDSVAHQLQASLGLPRTGNLHEVVCGSVDIPLQQLDRGKDHEEWRQICDERQQLIGTMLCKVRHEELVVFMAKDYLPLSELLHKVTSGLTSQISEALPGQLRRLAEIFLNIFQVTNHSSEWLTALVEDEIDGTGQQAHLKKLRFNRRLKSGENLDLTNANERQALRDMGKTLAGEANLLFRGNSLLTQALEFHMRRLGKDYIDEVLGEKIHEINEINPNCEVDPGKLQQGEDIEQHWDQLLQFTNEIWDCVVRSASKFPPELRHILKYVRAVAEDRYGDFLRTVAFTSVSGFLFLRFICPAILNPKLFGLLRDYPRPQAQRTLTLIAKALQALANLSGIGKKEVWMEPMNRFLSARRQSLKDFIDEICAIPAERSSNILPASYSTPITILGRLSPLAREGFPSLPFLIDHARNFASLVRLWADHHQNTRGDRFEDKHGNEEGSDTKKKSDILAFHEHCMALQSRANALMTRLDEARAAELENGSQPTDSDIALADALEHVSLADMPTANIMSQGGSSAVTPWMSYEKPPGSSGGSSYEEERGQSLRGHKSAEGRRARPSRHTPFGSVDSQASSQRRESQNVTIKSLRNGKHAKKFLGGILRRLDRDKNNGSPDASSSSQSGSQPTTAGPNGGGAGLDSSNKYQTESATSTPTGTMRRDKEKVRGLQGLVDGWKEM